MKDTSLRWCWNRFQRIPFYPLLFGIYPVVALMGVNVSEVVVSALWRPLAVLAAGSLLLFIVFRLWLKDWHRAAAATAVILFLFFTYGHLYGYLKTIRVGDFIIGRHRHLLPLWSVLGVLGLLWVSQKRKQVEALTPTLNLIAIFLLIYPSFQITTYSWEEARARREAAQRWQAGATAENTPLGYLPDVYYIILDAYGRADLLQEVFEYDNSPFLDDLETLGFYVADCSQSNYAQSMLSITSSLNMNYLDALSDKFVPGSTNRAPLRSLGKDNAARRFLEGLGYTTISFATNFPASEWEDADYFLTPPPQGLTEFENLLADTSLARAYMDLAGDPPEEITAEWYRRRTLSALEHLETTVPDIPGPKFVFVHLVIPHHPFVFGPNGEPRDNIIKGVPDFPEYVVGYRDHVTYINKRIEKVLRIILETSPRPPVIVIQGDHGPAPFGVIENRMKILNAYYLPAGNDDLYESITPVNTFRLIFNTHFGTNYRLLEDVSYFSEYETPYDYVVIPNTCK